MEANPEKEQFYRTTPNLKNGFVKMAQSRLGSTLATTFLPDIHRSFNVDDKGPDRFLQSAVTHRQAAYSSFLRSSSSFRNAKWKLDTLHQTLTATESQVSSMLTTTKELRLKMEIISKQLLEEELPAVQTELTKIINQLRKSISIEAKMDGLRYDTLKETCKGIARTSKALREDVDQIKSRIGYLENVLGFYGFKEKLKY